MWAHSFEPFLTIHSPLFLRIFFFHIYWSFPAPSFLLFKLTLFTAFTSAPSLTSILTVAEWPIPLAIISAVYPSFKGKRKERGGRGEKQQQQRKKRKKKTKGEGGIRRKSWHKKRERKSGQEEGWCDENNFFTSGHSFWLYALIFPQKKTRATRSKSKTVSRGGSCAILIFRK